MPATENVFDDKFWDSQDFITNALDNIKARLTWTASAEHAKPLLESGTLGTKCNTVIVVPYVVFGVCVRVVTIECVTVSRLRHRPTRHSFISEENISTRNAQHQMYVNLLRSRSKRYKTKSYDGTCQGREQRKFHVYASKFSHTSRSLCGVEQSTIHGSFEPMKRTKMFSDNPDAYLKKPSLIWVMILYFEVNEVRIWAMDRTRYCSTS